MGSKGSDQFHIVKVNDTGRAKPIYLYKTSFHKLFCAHNKNAPVSMLELPSSCLGNINLSEETSSFIQYECELSTDCQLYSSNVPGVWCRRKENP